MNKNKIISVIILILGVSMIGFGLVITSLNDTHKNEDLKPESSGTEKPNEEKEESNKDENAIPLDYNEAYNIAVSLYQYGDNTVEVEEKEISEEITDFSNTETNENKKESAEQVVQEILEEINNNKDYSLNGKHISFYEAAIGKNQKFHDTASFWSGKCVIPA